MSDPAPRAPLFFQAADPDSAATSAHFARVPHPRASSPASAQRARQSPTPPRAHAAPAPPPSPALHEAAAPPEPDQVPRPTPPPARFQANFPMPPPSHPDLGHHSRPSSYPQFEEAIASLRLHASRLAEQARSDALEIGFQVARRILETELTTSAEPLFALVRSAVRRVGDARKLVIKLHPDDAARVDTVESRAQLGLSLLQVEVIADSTLSPGDAVVETDNTTVDGRLSTRLDEVKRAVSLTVEEEPT